MAGWVKVVTQQGECRSTHDAGLASDVKVALGQLLGDDSLGALQFRSGFGLPGGQQAIDSLHLRMTGGLNHTGRL